MMNASTTPDDLDDPLSGDPELRNELAVMFLEDCPKRMAEILAAVAGHDGSALKLAAHTLKGSVGVFRVPTAYEAALRMEHTGRDNDWDHAENARTTLEMEMTNLSATLKEFTKSAKPGQVG